MTFEEFKNYWDQQITGLFNTSQQQKPFDVNNFTNAFMSPEEQAMAVPVVPNMQSTDTSGLGGFMSDAFGKAGWASPLMSAVGGLWQAKTAADQLDLAKEKFDFQQGVWAKNWDAQKNTTNAQLADRQSARLAANPNGYASVGEYMDKYGIK